MEMRELKMSKAALLARIHTQTRPLLTGKDSRHSHAPRPREKILTNSET